MAGRIPQVFIDDLLDRVDIVEVIDPRTRLKRTGRNYTALCPFHKEKTPSFTVNLDKQFYYCFGCGAGGNALGFLMEYERLDFPAAVEALARMAGLEVPKTAGRLSSEEDEGKRKLYDLLAECASFYRSQLRNHRTANQAIDYLKGRGLTGEIARQFAIGFAPPGWDNLLNALGGGDSRREQLEKAGMLIRRDSGGLYDRFRDRILFPIRDVRGRTIGFGGRVLGNDTPKYLNSPETPVFSKGRELYGLYEARQARRQLEQLLVVEGYMDVVALAQNGITCAVATLGTAVGDGHLERLFRYCQQVVFCFDGDAAGRGAARRALEMSLKHLRTGRGVRFLFLPEGEDPDSLVRGHGRSDFEQRLNRAMGLSEFLLNSAGDGLDLSSIDDRARLASRAMPLIQKVPDRIFRQLLGRELAARTGLDPASIEPEEPTSAPPDVGEPPPRADEPGAGSARAPVRPRQRQALDPRHQRIETTPLSQALALLLHNPHLAAQVGDLSELATVEEPNAGLLAEMVAMLQANPGLSTENILGRWLGTERNDYAVRLLAIENLWSDVDGAERGFHDALARLSHNRRRATLESERRELETIGLVNMSPEQKARYRELLAQIGPTSQR